MTLMSINVYRSPYLPATIVIIDIHAQTNKFLLTRKTLDPQMANPMCQKQKQTKHTLELGELKLSGIWIRIRIRKSQVEIAP